MPTFHRLLVLSALALSISVQAATLGAVESRKLSHVSRSASPDVVPEYDDGAAAGLEHRGGHGGVHKHRKGKGKGKGSRQDAFEARDYQEDSLGLERRRRHGGSHKHRKNKGKGSRRPASTNPPPPRPEARDYDDDNTLDACDYDVNEKTLEARQDDDSEETSSLERRGGHGGLNQHRKNKGKGSLRPASTNPPAPPPEARECDDEDVEEDSVGLERRGGHDGFHKHRKNKGKGSRRPASANPPPPPEARELQEDAIEGCSLTELD